MPSEFHLIYHLMHDYLLLAIQSTKAEPLQYTSPDAAFSIKPGSHGKAVGHFLECFTLCSTGIDLFIDLFHIYILVLFIIQSARS